MSASKTAEFVRLHDLIMITDVRLLRKINQG